MAGLDPGIQGHKSGVFTGSPWMAAGDSGHGVKGVSCSV